MHYHISSSKPASRFIEITLTIDNITDDIVELHLPSWRPGRYELGNFSRNIQQWAAFDHQDRKLLFHKTNKDTWQVETQNVSTLIIRYNYYAIQPDAGGCWTDEKLLYINPVHLCLYVDDRMHLPCTLKLDVPADWITATGLMQRGNNLFESTDFHNLVDCPVMSSPSLLRHSYEVNNINFNIWISGECKPNWKKLISDFSAFTQQQLTMMQSFPVKEYHFLILILPYKFYHGVEHGNSTVLALGPGYKLMQEELYFDLIGVASHELFHAWNVKAIRPLEMLPYNYTVENYSTLGWVYEGFTTYYGDLFLARCATFNVRQYLYELSTRLQKHMDNYGRFNYSVSESSFDTWLDGYTAGIPGRKTSIYDEGSLIALIIDIFIRKNSKWKYSLDDLMVALYKDFAMHNRGYREEDIKALVENLSETSADDLFSNYINGRKSYDAYLQELLAEVGCYISKKDTVNNHERLFGFKTLFDGITLKVSQVAPGSPAELAGLSKDDELSIINNIKIENNISELITYFSGEEITLEVFTLKKKHVIKLYQGKETYYPTCSILPANDATEVQKVYFKQWCGLNHSTS